MMTSELQVDAASKAGLSQPPPHIKTTLEEVTHKLPYELPCRVFLKNEWEQPSGSFKIRGLGNQVRINIEKARSEGAKNIEVVLCSGGNAGLAAAYAARYYGIGCTVVLPTVSKKEIVDTLKSYQAKVVVVGKTIYEAEQYLKNVLVPGFEPSTYLILAHAFNDPLVWEGHASIIDEITEQLGPDQVSKVKQLVCSVGGGGLYNGIVEGLVKNNFDPKVTELLLIEAKEAPTMTESVKAGRIVQLKSVNSVATSLAVSYLSKKSLELYLDPNSYKTNLEAIDDIETVKALIKHYYQTGVVVEPACGAALSVVYNKLDILKKQNLTKEDIVVIVVCGGMHTNLKSLKEFEIKLNQTKAKL